LAELLAENERLEKMLHGSTPGGGETAPVLKGVGGNSGGSWLLDKLEGACLVFRGFILRSAALSRSTLVTECSRKTELKVARYAGKHPSVVASK